MNRPARRAARRGDRQCRAVLDGVYWTKPQAGFSGGGVGISDSSRTADPRAAGGGTAAPAASLDQVRDRGDCPGWRRIGRIGQRERRCGGLLRRASGLGCLDGDEDRAADSECGRHVGSCRRDWVGDSNPLTPIIDFGHLVISAGPTAQFPAQFGRQREKGSRERRPLRCRNHGEPTYGWVVRSLITSASNVASLTSYAA